MTDGRPPQTIIHLLESVQVANNHSDARIVVADPRQFSFKMCRERPNIRNPGQMIRGRGAFGMPICKRVFKSESHVQARCSQNSNVFPAECILARMVKRQYT